MRLTMIRALFLTVASVAVLGACASTGAPDARPLTPLSRYSLRVEPGLDRIALAVHEDGLSANQQAALADLAGRYRAAGIGMVRVEAPSGDDPAAAASRPHLEGLWGLANFSSIQGRIIAAASGATGVVA